MKFFEKRGIAFAALVLAIAAALLVARNLRSTSAALRAELGQAGREKMQRYALDAVLPQVMDRYLSVMEGKTR